MQVVGCCRLVPLMAGPEGHLFGPAIRAFLRELQASDWASGSALGEMFPLADLSALPQATFFLAERRLRVDASICFPAKSISLRGYTDLRARMVDGRPSGSGRTR